MKKQTSVKLHKNLLENIVSFVYKNGEKIKHFLFIFRDKSSLFISLRAFSPFH